MRIIADGFVIEAEPRDSILAALQRAGRQGQHVCGGRGMCGTCRVAIDAAWWDRLAPPAFAETRLLRVLKNAGPGHRLACQTILQPEHDGLAFTLDSPTVFRQTVKETKP